MDVVLASHNRGKCAELDSMLSPLGWTLQPLADFTADAAPENAPTFVENAIAKARFAAEATGLPALADDSGLAVDALGGAPGVRSARYAGDNANDADNNRCLLDALSGVPQAQRSAQFICVLVFVRHPADPTPRIAQGRWPGRILEAPRGDAGFGYDPLFHVPERDCSSAELAPADKNAISHRARAVAALLETA